MYNKLNTVAAWLLTNYSDDAATVAAVEKIKAWELMNLQIELSDENNSSWDGYITVSNITGKINPQLTGWKNFYDERKFQVIDGKVTVPVYVGHNYNLKSNIKKVDGTELEYQLQEFVFGKDMQYVYNYLTDEVSNSTATGAKIKVTINRNNYPFNLVAVKNVDMFELTWQWNDTADFTAKYFKVFRNNLPIKTVAAKSVNLPLLNQDGNCDYFVVAYDAADNPSLASRKFTVVPGDLSEYNEFFNWLEEKFPGQNMTSQDDPDNDGLNNYQEFLEESDPAVASGPLPHLINRGFSSLTLQWSAVPRPDQAGDVMYQVMRNNNLIATVSECEFSDSNLVPGIGYDYKVRAILNNQPLGDWSRKSTVFTQHKHRYTNSELVEQTVDALLLQKFNTTDAGAFINGVRSAFEALSGNSVAFNTVDNGILNSLIANELADISAAEKINSDAERIAAEAALEEYLAKNWGGNQFEAVYINAMLHKLGDIYWDRYSNDKSDVAAFDNAIQLYEFSLNFLKNHAQTTLNTLCGLGQMYLSRLSENSSNAEIMLTLEKNRDYLLSFFVNFSNDQIPESMINPLASIVLTNRKYYHKLFSYDNYESEFYEHEKQLIEYGANTFKTESVLADFRRIINSWALIGVPCNWSGNNGRLVIRNLSTAPEYKFYPLRFELDDVRTFDFDSARELKFYRGHKYEIIFESDVAGGEVFRDKLGSFIFEKPISITYVPGSTPQVTEAALNAESSLNIINSGITFPYNLQAETLPDSFTLNWQFVAPDGYQLQKFNVYRGDNLIGESAVTSLANVPREKYDDGVYAYYVTAVDNSGVESGKSPVLVLTPDFTAEEEAYFAWKQQYFGNNVSLSGDDPDNDGLSNYQEFILGTDPLTASSSALPDISGDKIPGVTVKYFKISLSDFNQFKKINPYREDTVSKICFPVNDGQVLTSGLKNNVAMQASGYFEVPSTGEYNFLLSADDGCQLKINDVVVLEDLYLTDDREISQKVRLRQGINKFEILYFNNSEKSKFELYWGGSDDVMKLFDESNLFTLSEDNARKMQCYIALKRDSDWDGLVDHEELLLGSDH
ncbi:MAG: PA14 domain-containing protein, partial [Victivallaceae bacterium]